MTIHTIGGDRIEHDIPLALRKLAEEIESGKLPAERVFAVIDLPARVHVKYYGKPCEIMYAVGALHHSAHLMFASSEPVERGS